MRSPGAYAPYFQGATFGSVVRAAGWQAWRCGIGARGLLESRDVSVRKARFAKHGIAMICQDPSPPSAISRDKTKGS